MFCNCRIQPELYPSEAAVVDDLLAHVAGQIPYQCHRCAGYFRIHEVTREIVPLSEDDHSRLASYQSWRKEVEALRELEASAHKRQND